MKKYNQAKVSTAPPILWEESGWNDVNYFHPLFAYTLNSLSKPLPGCQGSFIQQWAPSGNIKNNL